MRWLTLLALVISPFVSAVTLDELQQRFTEQPVVRAHFEQTRTIKDLPQPLRWFTGNIGMHHVHHLASRIPFYRLPNVLAAYPQLASLNRMTIREAFKPFLLTLWDEDQRRLISFREAKATAAAA